MNLESYVKTEIDELTGVITSSLLKPVLPIVDWGTQVYAAASVASTPQPTVENGIEVMTKEEASNYIETHLKDNLIRLLNFCQTYEAILFVDGPNNFRKVIESTYKNNRVTPIPVYLELAKDIAVNKFGAILTNGYEADDAVIATYLDYKNKHIPCAIATVDKDLKQTECIYIRVNTRTTFSAEYITAEQASDNLLIQLLSGDSTDGIKGLPGVGPATAAKIIRGECSLTYSKNGVKLPLIPKYLKELNTYELRWLRVVEAYRNYEVPSKELEKGNDLPTDRMEYLLHQSRLVTMLRTINNFITPAPTTFKVRTNEING